MTDVFSIVFGGAIVFGFGFWMGAAYEHDATERRK